MGVGVTFTLARFSEGFLILRAGESGLAPMWAPGVMVLMGLAFTLSAYPAGALSDRLGRRRVVLAGYLLFATVSAGFAPGTGAAGFVVLFGLYGISFALVEANSRALVADLAPEAYRGGVLGLYYLVTSLAALPAALIAGLLWDLDPAWTFAYGAVLALAAAGVLGFGVREPRGGER